MIPYFLLLLPFAFTALGTSTTASGPSALLAASFLALFVGFRYETGGDWWGYFNVMKSAEGLPFSEVFAASRFEPLYSILNWIGANEFGGLVFINITCAIIFSFLLLKFCQSQPHPWLALTLSIPYLVIVVSMGYTRQAVAIAFEMIAILALQSGKSLRFIFYIFIASLFHRPALVLMGLLVFSKAGLPIKLPGIVKRLFNISLILIAIYGFFSAYSSSLITFIDGYQSDYSDYSPQGAFFRVGLTSLYGLIFLVSRKSFSMQPDVKQIWTGISVLSILAMLCLLIGFLPTAVDRLALYLLPLQLFVGSRLPETHLFGLTRISWKLVLVCFCFVFLFVWFNFALNSGAWLPYQNILFL